MHGQGVLKFADGSHLKAEWLKGHPQKGHWCSADDKTEYEGQFRGMLWHGYGTMHQTGVKKYMGKTALQTNKIPPVIMTGGRARQHRCFPQRSQIVAANAALIIAAKQTAVLAGLRLQTVMF